MSPTTLIVKVCGLAKAKAVSFKMRFQAEELSRTQFLVMDIESNWYLPPGRNGQPGCSARNDNFKIAHFGTSRIRVHQRDHSSCGLNNLIPSRVKIKAILRIQHGVHTTMKSWIKKRAVTNQKTAFEVRQKQVDIGTTAMGFLQTQDRSMSQKCFERPQLLMSMFPIAA